jgi:hypothetical protein
MDSELALSFQFGGTGSTDHHGQNSTQVVHNPQPWYGNHREKDNRRGSQSIVIVLNKVSVLLISSASSFRDTAGVLSTTPSYPYCSGVADPAVYPWLILEEDRS